MTNLPSTERELLIEALRVVNRTSGMLNDLSAALGRLVGDGADEGMHDMLLRRFADCSGVHLFMAADALRIDLPPDLNGDEQPS